MIRTYTMRLKTTQRHDDHKREVWRRLHPEDFQDDRPIYADMN